MFDGVAAEYVKMKERLCSNQSLVTNLSLKSAVDDIKHGKEKLSHPAGGRCIRKLKPC